MKPLSAQELAWVNGAPGSQAAVPPETAEAKDSAPKVPQASAEARVAGTLSVNSNPTLSEILVDGKSEGFTPGRVMLPPGRHSVTVQRSGYAPFSKDVTIATREETAVNAVLEKK